MLGSYREEVRELSRRRILHDGAVAIPDLVAAIEADLLREPSPTADNFRGQHSRIGLLAELEARQADGQAGRLIAKILDAAERGANFPGVPTPQRSRSDYDYDRIDVESNHSLVWLLAALDADAVAGRFAARLFKLRDLAAYGWRQEAQHSLEDLKLLDRLERQKLAQSTQAIQPLRWQAGPRLERDATGDYVRNRLAFSADGRWFAAAGTTTQIWDTRDWTLAKQFTLPAVARAIAFSADGCSLWIASDSEAGSIAKWDWRKAEVTRQLSGPNQPVFHVQLSPKGESLIAVSGKRALHSDGSLAYEETQVSLLNPKTGESRRASFPVPLASGKFLTNGEWFLYQGAEPRGASLVENPFRPANRETVEEWRLLRLGESAPLRLPFQPKLVAWGGTDRFWSLELEKRTGRPGKNAAIVRLRSVQTPFAVITEIPGDFEYDPISLVGSSDGRAVLVNDHHRADLRATPSGELIQHWTGWRMPFGPPSALSPAGTYAAYTRAGWPIVVDTRTGKAIPLATPHAHTVRGISFSADGEELISYDDDTVVCRWNSRTGHLLERREEGLLASFAESFAPPPRSDGSPADEEEGLLDEAGRLWTFQDETSSSSPHRAIRIRVCSPHDHKRALRERVIEVDKDRESRPQLVPGEKYFRVGLACYSREDFTLLSAVAPADSWRRLVFTRDGSRYAISCERGHFVSRDDLRDDRLAETTEYRICVYDTRSGKLLFYQPIRAEPTGLAFSEDRRRLAAVDDDEQIEIWPLPQ